MFRVGGVGCGRKGGKVEFGVVVSQVPKKLEQVWSALNKGDHGSKDNELLNVV